MVVRQAYYQKRAREGTKKALTLLTERGYLLLVKTFTDEKAWEVQDELVETYFSVKTAEPKDHILAMLESLVETRKAQLQLECKQQEMEKAQQELRVKQEETHRLAQAAMNTAECNLGMYSIKAFCNILGIRVTRKEAQSYGIAMSRICRRRGLKKKYIRDSEWGRIRSFPEDILQEYFDQILERN